MTPVEKLARKICEADGNGPDELVFNWTPCVGHGLLKDYWRIPPTDYQVPAWHAYHELARLALESLKEKDNG
jgi:hypothetical protein